LYACSEGWTSRGGCTVRDRPPRRSGTRRTGTPEENPRLEAYRDRALPYPELKCISRRRCSERTRRWREIRLSKKDIAIGSVTYNQYGYSYPSLYLSSRPGLSRTMADGGGLKPAVATQPPRAVNVVAGVPFSAGGGGVLISLATVQRCNGPTNRRHPGRAHLKLAAIGRRRRTHV